jgi:hypothetical protein
MMASGGVVVLGCLGGEKRRRRNGVYGAAKGWWKGNVT